MAQNACRTTAIALVTATTLSGSAGADQVRPCSEPISAGAPDEASELPPALEAFLDLIADLPEQEHREPPWRDPHGTPRPSPDREFIFPDFGKSRRG